MGVCFGISEIDLGMVVATDPAKLCAVAGGRTFREEGSLHLACAGIRALGSATLDVVERARGVLAEEDLRLGIEEALAGTEKAGAEAAGIV